MHLLITTSRLEAFGAVWLGLVLFDEWPEIQVWIGAVIMVLGGAVSLTDRRLRVGAPERRAKRRRVAGAALGEA